MKASIAIIMSVAIALCMAACSNGSGGKYNQNDPPQACKFVTGNRTVCSVSIYALLTRPKIYSGKEVLVEGYFAVDSGMLKLWPSKESFEFDIDADSISIDVPYDEAVQFAEDANRTYASVVGIFWYTPEQEFGIHSTIGTLTDVYRVFRSSKRVDTPLDWQILKKIPGRGQSETGSTTERDAITRAGSGLAL